MSQPSSEKYLYFTVGLLKGSAALDALRQDALKHHMVDQPGHLIALRLTEYYEMMTNGIVQPVKRVPAIMVSAQEEEGEGKEQIAAARAEARPLPPSTPSTAMPGTPESGNNAFVGQITGRMRALRREGESVIFTSPDADQNADEAADYWSTL